MSGLMRGYIRMVDAANYRIGRIVMYGIFVLMAILLWSSISKTFFLPSLWTLELAQFVMVAYYILGGHTRSSWGPMCGWIFSMGNGRCAKRRGLICLRFCF